MPNTLKFITIFSLSLIFSGTNALANGMYVPTVDKLPAKAMQDIGLKVTPEQVAELANGATAHYNGGCSSTFMSENGLIGTNWHCARGCVLNLAQEAASERGEKDPMARISQTGFVASKPSEELQCKGQFVKIPLEITNITPRFSKLLNNDKMNPKKRADAIKKLRESIREECRGDRKDLVCDVAFMNNDPQPFYLYKFKKINDVRLAWAPPTIVGMFGGMTDNWEYPRHTGDFAFLRVYENGKPYKPTRYAKASRRGVKPGDPQFILGFPGSTTRNMTSHAALFMQDTSLPFSFKIYDTFIKLIESDYDNPMDSPYGNSWFGLENYRENYQRQAELMKQVGVVKAMQKKESTLTNKEHLDRIWQIYQKRPYYYPTLHVLSELTHGELTRGRARSKSLATALYIYKWNTQPKKDSDREDRYKSSSQGMLEDSIKRLDLQSTLAGEKKWMASYFKLADTLPIPVQAFEDLKIETRKIVEDCYKNKSCKDESLDYHTLLATGTNIYQQMAEVLYAGTQMIAKSDDKDAIAKAKAYRLELFNNKGKASKSKDSLIRLAKALDKQKAELVGSKAYGADYSYELGLLNHAQNLQMGFEAPDANSTIRFTYSTVQRRYSPVYKKGRFGYTTTLSSLINKDRSVPRSNPDYALFKVPRYLKDARERADYTNKFYFDKRVDDIPIDFITQHVITGGSSGSAVYDKYGDVVGFAFDSTPEGVLSDVWQHPESRTVIVDLRYAAFLGDQIFTSAKPLLRELGLDSRSNQITSR